MAATLSKITIHTLTVGLLVFGVEACDQNVTVTGTVHDQSGVPLENVAVTLQMPGREPDSAKSAKDGSFNVGIVGADPRQTRISFQKQGYQWQDQPLGEQPRPILEITLLPDQR